MERKSKILRSELFYSIILIFATEFLIAQPINELGIPYIKNYPPKIYKGEGQIFGINQDEDGILYFTGNGITEYDGETWRRIPPIGVSTLSFINGADGKIYVGGIDELGFLQPNKLGQKEFISLKELLPKNQKEVGQLRQIATLKENVFFASRTTGYLIRYNYSDKKIKVWAEEEFNILGTVYNELYLSVSGKGLCKLIGDEIETLVEEKHFLNSPLISILPFRNGDLLICTRDQGLFVYDGTSTTPFKTEADKLLYTRTYFAKSLPDDKFLFSIIGQGIIVVDEKGNWLQHFTKDKGLIDDIVLNATVNSKGEVWLGTYKGLSKLDLLSPISRFILDEKDNSIVTSDIVRANNNIYVASFNVNGLLYLDKEEAVFRKVRNTPNGLAFKVIKSKSDLYGVSNGDIFKIDNTNGKVVYKGFEDSRFDANTIHQSLVDSNQFFLGLNNGLASIRKINDSWVFEHKYEEIPDNLDLNFILEYPATRLWLGTSNQGVYVVDYENQKSLSAKITKVQHLKEGLKKLDFQMARLFFINDKITITGAGGIFNYDENNEDLIPDNRFSLPIPHQDVQAVKLTESLNGDVYAHFSKFDDSMILGVYRLQHDKSYKFEIDNLSQIPNEDLINVPKLLVEPNGILWIGSHSGLIRFDTKKETPKNKIPTKIREVHLNSDSLIFAGHGIPSKPKLSITQNSINFHYLAPTINITGTNQYQTKLEGFDKEWSDWTEKTEKAYTNLHEGTYTFKAKGKTPTGQLTKEASYSFTVLPPWWRTWWAYVSYVFLGGLSLYLFSQWRNRQLLERSKELELIIEERTAEIKELFQEAQEARAAAEAANEAKSTFLSTVSHELRTPLTSVIGFAKIIKKRLDERILPFVQSEEKKTQRAIKQVTQNLDVVVSEGERLTTLINDVLDLAKIEAGRFDWHMDFIQIEAVIKQATAATSALFEQKALPLELVIDETLPAINADKDRLVQVVINLISNAVKFTDEGTIKVSAIQENGSIVVSVKDSGIGISAEDLPKVFEKFKQVGDTLTDKPKGTGLGLPICKEIVEHHQGEIWVESEFGAGSIFKFNIPLSTEQPIAKTSLAKEVNTKEVHQAKKEASITKGVAIQKTILIVDDEPDIRSLLRQEISEAGFLVQEAVNGKEGIERIRERKPDLLILDVMMPEMNGFDVAAILKNDPATKDIPIIIVSITDDKKRIAQLGIEGYLTKPIDIDRLLKEINALLN